MSVRDFRTAAPPFDAGVARGRFEPRTALDDGRDQPLLDRAVRRARDGDREALGYLYLRYADNVYGYVSSIVRDNHEAEDITQQVFAKLLSALAKYEPREVPFSAWILRVARNAAVDHMRARRPLPCEEVREPGAEIDSGGRECARSLRDALATLPDAQRKVFFLRHVVGLSPGEIAGRIGRSESAVHGLHHRARGALQRALLEMQAGPATVRTSRAVARPAPVMH